VSRIRAAEWCNALVTLTDGDVAALAGQAADLVEASLEVRIAPDAGDDPYRWGAHSWTVHFDSDGRDGVAVWLSAAESPVAALARLIGALDGLSETRRFWGRALPACPGHPHPARVDVESGAVVLRCPVSGQTVRRVRPALAP
jgi:hypothetical protein